MRALLAVADGLILVTAAIHAVLAFRFLEAGFALDTVQFAGAAAGYVLLAALLTGDTRRSQLWIWVTVAYTALVIVLWAIFGSRTPLAYADKVIEVILIGVLGALAWGDRHGRSLPAS